MVEISSCPVCHSGTSVRIEHRDDVPVMMHKLYDSAEAARQCRRGTLDMRQCQHCGFSWNAQFDASLVEYSESYENDQTHSPVFAAHVDERAKDVVHAERNNDALDFLEVGCGQGGFLRLVAREAGVQLRSAEGFDPAFRGEGFHEGLCRIHKTYFSEQTVGFLHHTPNVVASRHTIEHVPDPVSFLRAIRKSLGPKSNAVLFIETPCVDWILNNRAMQDIFYEHCSIFTATALDIALKRSGFDDVEIAHVFGGQYLWARATATQPKSSDCSLMRASYASPVPQDAMKRCLTEWQSRLSASAVEGKIALWGAGAKGITFAQVVDPNGELIDHVIDINPGKQNHFLPGTGLKVLAPQAAVSRGPRSVFVMNPNYLAEIEHMALLVGLSAQFIPVK